MTDRASTDDMLATMDRCLADLTALGDRQSQLDTLGWLVVAVWGLLPWNSVAARSAELDGLVATVKQQLATADLMTDEPAGSA